MGLHSERMARAGARLTSVDLSETSVAATRKRFEIKGLSGDIRQMDARRLDFPDEAFDFVWTWGVIHHSAQTGVIVREIHRGLESGGQMRSMVYNLDGFPAYRKMMAGFALGFWWGRSLDECLWASTDGYMARHDTVDGWQDLLSTFFHVQSVVTLGQDSDAVGLPRGLRHLVMKLYSGERLARKGNARGSFLFSIADKPRDR